MTLAIIGSRGIKDLDLSKYIESTPDCIVSGGAKGVDTLAAQYARANGIRLIELRPDYESHGRAATFIRNREIIDMADSVLAFWDGKSRGTEYTVNYALRKCKPVNLINFYG